MKYRRLIIGCLLLFSLLSLMSYYCSFQNQHDPSIEYIVTHYSQYHNTRISFSGESIAVNTTMSTFFLQLDEPPYTNLTVAYSPSDYIVHPRDILEVTGILDGPLHVTAIRLVVYERWKYDLIYLRSLPAIPFVLFLVFRTWRFDRTSWRFQLRRKINHG